MWDFATRWFAGHKHRRRRDRGCAPQPSSNRFIGLLGTTLLAASVFVLWALLTSFRALPRTLQLEQRCRMSRMWPSYMRYDIPSSTGLNAKYHLFLYREAPPNTEISGPSGRPVIFVPGNAGSYGQVRSLASSTHHLYQRGEWQGPDVSDSREPDWWAIHFNEDFSAFHGETLREEAQYFNDVVAYLLQIYPGTKSIPVVAHSMGGIVARLAMLEHNYQPGSIETIVTLSSPHAYPPVPLDRGIDRIYQQLHDQSLSVPVLQNETLLISLSGGILDDQLSSEASLLHLSHVWPTRTSLHAFTSSLAALWSGVDHLAMMWCDQLRERVARAILRIEGHGKDLADRRQAWKSMLGMAHHSRVFDDSMDSVPTTRAGLAEEGADLEVDTINVPSNPFAYFELITSSNVGIDPSFGPPISQNVELRVLLCSKDGTAESTCQAALPEAFTLFPPSPFLEHDKGHRIYPTFPEAEMRYEEPGKSLHRIVIARRQFTEGQFVQVRVEKDKGASGSAQYSFSAIAQQEDYSPNLWSTITIYLEASERDRNATREVIVPGMDSTIYAYDVYLAGNAPAATCTATDATMAPMLLAQSLSTGDAQFYPSIQIGVKYTLMLHATSPYIQPAPLSKQATLFSVMLDPCKSIDSIRFQVNWRASLGLLVSRYRTAVVAVPFSIVLISTMLSWLQWDAGMPFPEPTSSLAWHGKITVPTWFFLSVAASSFQKWSASQNAPTGVLVGDRILGLAFGIPTSPMWVDATLAALFALAGYGLAVFSSIAMAGCVYIISMCIPKRALKSSGKETGRRADALASKIPKSSIAGLAGIAVAVYFLVPVQFVNLVLFLVQLGATAASRTRKTSNSDQYRQNLTILNIYLWTLPLNSPALLVWVRNLLNGWHEPLGGSDHNIARVLGYLLLTFAVSSGHLIPREGSKVLSSITTIFMLKAFVLVTMYGIRFTHIIFSETNQILSWLSLLCISHRVRSVSELSERHLNGQEASEVERTLLNPNDSTHSLLPGSLLDFARQDALPESLAKSLRIANGVENEVEAYSIPTTVEVDKGDKDGESTEHLDALLSEYLTLLDKYLGEMQLFTESMTQGAFQVSRAKMQVGKVRMGDSWDARMQASTRTRIGMDNGTLAFSVNLHGKESSREEDREDEAPADDKAIGMRRRRPDRPKAENRESLADSNKMDKKETKNAREPAPYDPLYQFAALPPPALRTAQKHYLMAISAALGLARSSDSNGNPDSLTFLGLCNIQRKLLALEGQIRRARAESNQML